jgi:hypothetical protein
MTDQTLDRESKVYVDRMKGTGGHRYLWFTNQWGVGCSLDLWTGTVRVLGPTQMSEEFGYRRVA